jgi:hypothetical protein
VSDGEVVIGKSPSEPNIVIFRPQNDRLKKDRPDIMVDHLFYNPDRRSFMKLILHIALSAQPKPGHNEAHPILLSMNGQPPFVSKITPRGLSGLLNAGFSGIEIGNAQKELIEKGTTVLEGANIDENYVRQFFADAA